MEKYDVFIIGAATSGAYFARQMATRGSPEWAFEFTDGYTVSPFGNYPLHTVDNTVGLHMHEYIMLLNNRAQQEVAVLHFTKKC